MATTLYPLLDFAAPANATKPSAVLGTYTVNSNTGASSKYLSQSPANAQLSQASASQTADTTQRTYCYATFISDPLAAQAQIGSGNWTVGFAVSSATSTNAIMSGWCSIFLLNPDGTINTTIAGGATPVQVGANQTTGTVTEHTCWSATISGAAFTPAYGCRIAVELAVGWKRSSGSGTNTLTGYTSGTTAITSDNAATSSAQSFVTCPTTLAFAVPWSVVVSAGTVADASGLGCQGGHLIYGRNSGKWWALTYRSASNTTLYARYSSDFGYAQPPTWNDPTNNTKALTNSNGGNGRCLGMAYANIASTDIVHCNLFDENTIAGAKDDQYHIRATLAGSTVTWGTEVASAAAANNTLAASVATATAVASDGSVFDADTDDLNGINSGDFAVRIATNKDTGTSWTTGFPSTGGTLLFSSVATVSSFGLAPLSSGGKVLALSDNGSTTGTPNNIESSLYNGSSWSPANPAATVFATNVSIDVNDWGMALRTDTDFHAVRRNNSTSTFTHRRSSDANTWSAGDSIGNHTCLAGGGLAMASDGASVWLFIIDSASGNAIYVNQWVSGTGWLGWTAVEQAPMTRKFITAYYDAAQNVIGLMWMQANVGNWDLTAEAYPLRHPENLVVMQAVNRAAVF